MRRLPPAVVYMMHHSQDTPKKQDNAEHVFLDVVTSAYDDYAREAADKAAERCRDDLAAMTRFVTWDLAAAQTDAISAVRDWCALSNPDHHPSPVASSKFFF